MRMRNTAAQQSIAAVLAAALAAVGQVEIFFERMELGQKTLLQFSDWLTKEGFSETIVKIFKGMKYRKSFNYSAKKKKN